MEIVTIKKVINKWLESLYDYDPKKPDVMSPSLVWIVYNRKYE